MEWALKMLVLEIIKTIPIYKILSQNDMFTTIAEMFAISKYSRFV